MPSAFDTDFALSAGSDLLVDFGEEVTYEAVQADPVSITAAVQRGSTDDVDGEGVKTSRREIAVTVSTDPSSTHGGVAKPAIKDKVVIDGEKWTVVSITRSGGGLAELRCRRNEPSEVAYSGYRAR